MLILLLHFVLVIIYADPFASGKSRLRQYAQWYANPFFHQNWNVFVPPPDTNYHLYAEYENNGIVRRDLFTEIMNKHRSNRLAGSGPILLAFANSIHYFEKNTKLAQSINGPVKNDPYFKMIEHSALNYLKHSGNISGNKLRLILVVENVRLKNTKVYFN